MRAELLNGRGLGSALLLGGLALSIAACRTPDTTPGLPDALAVVLDTLAGEQVSLLVSLPRPGVDPVVRLSPGAVAVTQGRVGAYLTAPSVDGRVQVSLLDLYSMERSDALLDGPVRLTSLRPDRAELHSADGQLSLRFGDSVSSDAHPAGTFDADVLEHPGPGTGFGARIEEERFEIRLPREDGLWAPVLMGVDRIIGLSWIDTSTLPPWQFRVLDDRFKQVRLMTLAPGLARFDGELSEWRDERSLALNHPSQILMGQTGWTGERDGATGIAARRDEQGELVLAARIRDDHWDSDRDGLIVRWGDQEIFVMLGEAGRKEGPGWEAVVRKSRLYERTVEVRVQVGGRLDGIALGGAIPGMMIEHVDGDPHQPVTLLSSAPWPAMLAFGGMVLDAHRPARPAPQ